MHVNNIFFVFIDDRKTEHSVTSVHLFRSYLSVETVVNYIMYLLYNFKIEES